MRLPPFSTKACSFAGGNPCDEPVLPSPSPAISPFWLMASPAVGVQPTGGLTIVALRSLIHPSQSR